MIVANVIANLIVFVALLEFANRTVEWFGVRAGAEVTLEVSSVFICTFPNITDAERVFTF